MICEMQSLLQSFAVSGGRTPSAGAKITTGSKWVGSERWDAYKQAALTESGPWCGADAPRCARGSAAGRHADAAALVGGVLAVVLEALDKLAQARRT